MSPYQHLKEQLNFSIRVYDGDHRIPMDINLYPDGQIQLKTEYKINDAPELYVDASINNSFTLDAWLQLQTMGTIVNQRIMYSYGSRSDKVSAGVFSVSKTSNMIVGLHDTKEILVMYRPHDPYHHFFGRHSDGIEGDYLFKMLENYNTIIFPDESAMLRLTDRERLRLTSLASKKQCSIHVATKVRDPESGEIVLFEFNNSERITKDSKILVVDDICDGGATFIKLKEQLNKKIPLMTQTELYVSHGVFSNSALSRLESVGYHKVHVSNSLSSAYNNTHIHNGFLHVFDIWER